MEKFSFNKLLIKLTSRKFFVWAITTYFTRELLYILDGDKSYFPILVIGWFVVTVVYLIGEPIENALSAAVEKMELKLQMNNSMSTNINKTN